MDINEYYPILMNKIKEIKAGIANGSIIPKPTWDLEEDFNAWMAPGFLKVLSINGSISMAMHFLVFWLIGFKTPKEMKDYRLFLLNIAVISFLHDIQLTIYWRPVPFFPISGAFVQGPSRIIGDIGGHWGMVTSVVVITLYMCSMVCGFLYRLVSLMDTFYYRLMMSWIGLGAIIIIHGFPSILLGGMMYFSHVPSEIIRNKTLQRYPQLAPVLETEAVFGYDVDVNPMLLYFFFAVLFFIFLAVPVIEIGCIGAILYKLKKMKNSMTAKTYKLHKNLLFALTIQILLPQFMILIPDVAVVFGAWRGLRNVTIIVETSMMVCTCHSVLDNFVMMLFITPYRRTLLKICRRSLLKNYEIKFSIQKKSTVTVDTNATSTQVTSPRRHTLNSLHH